MSGRLNDCGCCQGLAAQTPAEIQNRPGLTAIAYRVGTHAQFKQSMLTALSDPRRPALKALSTRDVDDFSIALLDAAATMADVLTFYQERIANESYLRTATERRSLLELARLIGYELRPGVAAKTLLAFTLEDAPGVPRRTTIDVGVKVQSIPGPGEKPQTFETIKKIEARTEWNAMNPPVNQVVIPHFGSTYVYLRGTSTNLKPGDAILFVGSERGEDPGSERWDFRQVKTVVADYDAERTRVEWEEGLGSVLPYIEPAEQPEVYALRQRASLFGHNAPHPRTLSDTTLAHYGITVCPKEDWSFDSDTTKRTIDLDATYPGILRDSWLVLAQPDYWELYRVESVVDVARTDFTLTAKTTRVKLDTDENLDRFIGSNLRSTVVFAQSELLHKRPVDEPYEEPISTPVGDNSGSITLALPIRETEGLTKGRMLVASGKDSKTGGQISEAVRLEKIEPAGDLTTLTFSGETPLIGRYARDTFRVNANVAAATHGETTEEVLGSGDASQQYQRFTLRQPPLTYVPAETTSGAESTLQVRVNDLLWHEVPTLYGCGSQEHVFVARTDDEGKTTVQFGDGVSGARLQSGQDNVRATYRRGSGLDGQVKAGQLSVLLTRPLGVKDVVNPEDAKDGDDPETLVDARRNAPLTVLTLDRTVSLQDYEDFARSFAGIAKALATWTWDGQTRRVFITVAGPKGAEVAEDSDTCVNLLKALAKAGDPFVVFRVKSYQKAEFRLAGSIVVDADFVQEKVLAAVKDALCAQFSFEARDFGQPVMKSEVVSVIQTVSGVIAVNLDALYRGEVQASNSRLLAQLPVMGADGDVTPAELLTLDPQSLDQLVVKT